MIKAVVKFWGNQKDNYGMHTPYHSYFVVASPWQAVQDGVASVVPLSIGAPLSRQHYPVTQGGERAAFDAAIAALKNEASNKGLSFSSHES